MKLRSIGFALSLAAFAFSAAPAWAAARDIVLVHGMGMDGSGWRAVYDSLRARGYRVTIVQQPLDGFDKDVAATRRAIAAQRGPVVLVGHSYGGVVVTTAGNDPKVNVLVYVAAFQPDRGETMGGLTAKMPPAFAKDGTEVTPDGYTIAKREVFVRDVAQDLPRATAEFLAASQAWTTTGMATAATADPAWRHKPSFGVVATNDRTINPDLERWMYRRSGATVTEVKSGHMVYMVNPQAVADVIVQAAESVK